MSLEEWTDEEVVEQMQKQNRTICTETGTVHSFYSLSASKKWEGVKLQEVEASEAQLLQMTNSYEVSGLDF